MTRKIDIKRLILLNLPYVFAFYFVNKIATVFRLAPGTEMVDKLTGGFANFGAAFANPVPSFNPIDLLVGAAAGALLKLAVYLKSKNWNDIIKVESTNTQKSDIIILPQSEEKTQKAGKRNVDLQ